MAVFRAVTVSMFWVTISFAISAFLHLALNGQGDVSNLQTKKSLRMMMSFGTSLRSIRRKWKDGD